jgi:hypothetical protein
MKIQLHPVMFACRENFPLRLQLSALCVQVAQLIQTQTQLRNARRALLVLSQLMDRAAADHVQQEGPMKTPTPVQNAQCVSKAFSLRSRLQYAHCVQLAT